jgi:hypothetical protein
MEPDNSRLPKRIEPRVLALLSTLLDKVVADIPLTDVERITRRMEALRPLAWYHALTAAKKVDSDAGRFMGEQLHYVEMRVGSRALVNRINLERATMDWVAAHLMSSAPFQQTLATTVAGWMRELP